MPLPARSAPKEAPAVWSLASLFSQSPAALWKSAVCCAASETENEVSVLVPMEVPGFAVNGKRVSKDLSAVSTEAGSDDER
jgi:hypothetical protein